LTGKVFNHSLDILLNVNKINTFRWYV